MENETDSDSDCVFLYNSSVKLQVKYLREERAHCKDELLKALQEVKVMRKRAIACEKRSRESEIRANKLAKKVELAVREAIMNKQVAEKSRCEGVSAQKIADNRRKLIKEITAKLRLAEQKARLLKKSVVMKQNLVNASR